MSAPPQNPTPGSPARGVAGMFTYPLAPGQAPENRIGAGEEGRGVVRRADARVIAATVVGGILTDLALRGGLAGVGGALLVAALAVGLVVAGRAGNRQAWLLAGIAAVFGAFLALRVSPWLVPLNAVAAAGLLALAAGLARGGSIVEVPFSRLAARAWNAVWHALAGPSYLWSGIAGTDRRGVGPALIGVALAVPIVFVLGALLGSADPVFASFFADFFDIDAEDVVEHTVLFTLGAWATAGLLRIAAAADLPATPGTTRRLDPVTVLVVLGAIDALFAVFAVAQLVGLGDGVDRILETAGLTYAEYARSGFFQLLAVAGLTVVTLLTLRARTRDSDGSVRRWLLAGHMAAVALTLALVVVAVRRLGLYVDVFGLTMLRLYSLLFSFWIGLVLVLVGITLARAGRRGLSLTVASAASGLAILLGLNVVNPEAIVVRQNLLAARGADVYYLSSLSADAVPAWAAILSDLAPEVRRGLLDEF